MQQPLQKIMPKNLQALQAIVASLDHPLNRLHLLLDPQISQDTIKDKVKLEVDLQTRLLHPKKLRSTEEGLGHALPQ